MSNLRFKVVEEAFKKRPVEVKAPAERPSEYFAKYVFNKEKMFKYLPLNTYQQLREAIEQGKPLTMDVADEVAKGMKRWAIENGVIYQTTTLPAGDYKIKNQLIKQLQKMPDVEKILELFSDSAVIRELVLIKINNNPEIRQDIMTVVDVFRAKIIDYASDVLTIEITGESSKIDAFVELVREFGIIEICRTGIVALERGKSNILDNKKRK